MTPISRQEMARRIREQRAAGLTVEVIGQTENPVGREASVTTQESWIELPGFPHEETLTTPSGSWKIETVKCETKKGRDNGWTTFRYTWAVTFLSDDSRRVEFTALDGRTRSEVIGSALWHELMGLATVTRSRRLAHPKRLG